MPFGLKNVGETYQRMATTLLHDMMHNEVKVYVDDMIVKSNDRAGHIIKLRKFFERIKEYRLRLNPQKCTFGVTTGNLLGFFVTPQTQKGPKHEKRNSKVPMYFSFLTNQSR